MNDFAGATVCILGMGLMGASAARRIKGRCKYLIGVDIRTDVIHYVLDQGWIDEGYQEINAIPVEPDILILCIPVRQILKVLDYIAIENRRIGLILDFGSTKKQIITKMKSFPFSQAFFACHPMCGKEISGPQSSDEQLYQDRPFLYHGINTNEGHEQILLSMIQCLGAKPIKLDAVHHDRQLAYVSHVPHLLSTALMLVSGAEKQEEKEALWQISAGGFQDMTRLAGSDLTMIMDILATNREEITPVLGEVIEELQQMKQLLEENQFDEIRQRIERAKALKESANQWRKS